MNRHYLLSCLILVAAALTLSLWKDANYTLFTAINSTLPWQTLWMTLTNSIDFLGASSLLFIFLRNNSRLLICSVIAGIVVQLCIHYSKLYFALPRPEHVNDLPHLITLGPALGIHNYAMPSGHTASAFMLTMMFAKCYSLQGWRLWALFFTAILIGISRVAVGAHWPSDIFAGAALGIMVGYWCSHEKLNLQQAGFKYAAYLIYGVIFVLSMRRITQITSASTAMTEGIIVWLAIVGVALWITKIVQEIRLRQNPVDREFLDKENIH